MISRVSLLLAAIGGALCTPGYAQNVDCTPTYAAKLSEAAASVRAEISAKAIKALSSQLQTALGSNATANAKIDARYSVSAAGSLAQTAYDDTVGSYFCSLAEQYKANPAALAQLEKARLDIKFALQEYFDAGLWMIEAMEPRKAVRKALQAGTNGTPAFKKADIDKALPNYDFDKTKLYEITTTIEVPNVIKADGCAGIVQSSIRQVNPQLLAELQKVRTTILVWLTDGENSGRIGLWDFVAPLMNNQLSTAQIATTTPVTRAMLVCVEKAEAAAVATTTTTAAPATQSGAGAAAAGGNGGA